MIAARLLTSLTNSTIDYKNDPGNEYIRISQKGAWELLKKLYKIPPDFAHAYFRHACGWEPCPARKHFDEWLKKEKPNFNFILKTNTKKIRVIDSSVGSLQIGHPQMYLDLEKFCYKTNWLLDNGTTLGVGGYLENRAIYEADSYIEEGNSGRRWRATHIGLDLTDKAGTPVLAPLDGIVHSFDNRQFTRDYGPVVILEHCISNEFSFYTLYGHLNLSSLELWEKGKHFSKGEIIGYLGNDKENGGWPAHLHFQVMLNMLGNEGDFPGVAFPEEKAVWKSFCPDPNFILNIEKLKNQKQENLNADEILQKRNKYLGPNLSLSYKKPLHIVRGYMQYLYDETGRRFLDTVNNVPHVGHQHPKVVQAVQRQAAVLNTNTRYLHKEIVLYAEELAATFPDPLEVCYFVNSGSEANELAIRMARTFTGQKNMLVLEGGYHGNTNACVEISSYKFDGKGGRGAENYIYKNSIPDTFRGKFKGKDAGEKYANFIQLSIEQIQKEGKGIAGFIAESILSCGGQIVLPEGYLKSVYQFVREAGGVCIADEVQVGFGRVGDTFWGFELQEVIPDIVVMGKPMGNGFPLAGVITTRKIADAFNNGMEYFNTFGGNPVACAAGRSVLNIIKENKLQQHAKEVGGYLKEKLNILKNHFSIIGDVRGHGLFLGFELIKNHETLQPAAEEASHLANRMRELGILMSTDGPLHNVIKIKPPLCFSKQDVDYLITTLEKVLKENFFQYSNATIE